MSTPPTITGTPGDDVLQGTEAGEILLGLSGNDFIAGGNGDDLIEGGDEPETPGYAADHLLGGDGNDTINGGAGHDYLEGGNGTDVLDGGSGDDMLVLHDPDGAEIVRGGDGADRFELAAYASLTDTMVADGGAGDDVFHVYVEPDQWKFPATAVALTGGAGSDTYVADIRASIELGMTTITDFAAGADGDRIDLGPLLRGNYITGLYYFGGNPFDPSLGFVRLIQDGAATLLQFDTDGATGSATFQTVFRLDNTLAQALTAANFVDAIAPDGSDVPGVVLAGTAGNDELRGGFFDDTLSGGAGQDVLRGDHGDDVIDGGDETGKARSSGDDIFGGAGNDLIHGGDGGDWIDGGRGDDEAHGDGGDDAFLVRGGEGSDRLYGGDGNDQFNLTADQKGMYQRIYADGGLGNDTFELSVGELQWDHEYDYNDTIFATGGAGSDTFAFAGIRFKGWVTVTDFQTGAGGDRIDVSWLLSAPSVGATGYVSGNPFAPSQGFLRLTQDGADTLLEFDPDGASSTAYQFRAVMVLENTTATAFTPANVAGGHAPQTDIAGTIRGTPNADNIEGSGGDDRIYGGAGADFIHGGMGDDLIEGGDESNSAGAPGDRIYGYMGKDTIHGGAGNDEIDGGWDEDVIDGGSGADTLSGGSENDLLKGGPGNDRLDGDDGADRLEGGAGDDTYVIDSMDTVVELANEGRDKIVAPFDYILGPTIEDIQLVGAADSAIGNALANVLTASDNGASLTGLAGNDRLVGGADGDMLDGGTGADAMLGGGGNDMYSVDSTGDAVTELADQGQDTVYTTLSAFTLPEHVESLIFDGDGTFSGAGNALDNTIMGRHGSATLKGEGGNDKLIGGSSGDMLSGGAGDDWMLPVSGGADVADGGDGTDTVMVALNFSDYVRTRPNATDLVLTGDRGTVTLRNVELVEFADGVRTLAELQENISSSGADVLHGTAGDDVLDGGPGKDALSGGLGDDTYVVSEAGDSVIEHEGEGIDRVQVAFSKAGAWTLDANVEHATVTAPSLAIHLAGNELDNELSGNAGANTLTGNGGNDVLDGKGGNDTMIGGSGDDRYVVDAAKDVVTELEAGGFDTVATSLSAYTLAAHVEALGYEGAGAFAGTGNAQDNVISGGKGADILKGEGGADTLVGGLGNDQLFGGLGDDILEGGAGADLIDGGADSDTVILDMNFDEVVRTRPNATDVVLTPSSGGASVTLRNVELFRFADGDRTLNEVIVNIASTSSDLIEGTGGADLLDGGLGKDELIGGEGDDTYVVSEAGDKVVEADGEGADIVHVSFKTAGTYVLADAVENALVTGTLPVNITGNGLDNILTGNSGKNTLIGGAGNDVLNGGGGADKLAGGVGDDVYRVDIAGDAVTELAGEGNDRVIATAGSFTLGANVEELAYIGAGAFNGSGNLLDNLIEGGSGADKLLGLGGDDQLSGGAGADFLDGGLGDDILDAGTGKDVLDGGAGNDLLRVLGDFADYVRYRPDLVNTLLVNEDTSEHITLRNVETIAFADGERTLAQVLDKVATGGNDVMDGTTGDDLLDGGMGTDTMKGGLGDDTYVVNVAADKVIELEDEGTDTVSVAFTAAGSYVLGAHVENATVAAGKLAVGVTGNALDNVIKGNAGANVLIGGAGSDTLTGGIGADIFVLSSKLGVDEITDFVSGADKLRISQAGLRIGDGDARLEGAVLRAQAGGFSTAAELVVFTGNVAQLDAASAAAAIGSANTAYAVGAQRLFALDNGTDSALFLFTAKDANAIVSAGELTQLALLTGTASTATADYLFSA